MKLMKPCSGGKKTRSLCTKGCEATPKKKKKAVAKTEGKTEGAEKPAKTGDAAKAGKATAKPAKQAKPKVTSVNQ